MKRRPSNWLSTLPGLLVSTMLLVTGTALTQAMAQALAQAPGQPPEPDILKPEQAFQYTVTADPGALVVHWKVLPGYYLYKERMSFESRTPGVTLGAAEMPTGKLHTDEYFGDMHIYRGTVEVRLPIVARSDGITNVALAIKSQGCADIGLCYPPQTWVSNTALPAAAASTGQSGGQSGGLAALLGKTGQEAGTNGSKDEPLPVDEAFRYRAELRDPNTLQVTWTIVPGYYLYRHTLGASTTSSTVQLGTPELPPGEPKVDEEYGNTLVFYDEVVMTVPLARSSPDAGKLPLTIHFQGCKENSICYPPQAVATTLELPAAGAAGAAAVGPTGGADLAGAPSEQDRLFTLIRDGNLLAVLGIFAGLGLLLSFTPCCLPMYPILSGIIVGHGKADGAELGSGKGFLLSLAFVLGMALTYTILGAVFAAAGGQVQAVMQQPAVIIGVALLFVALALSMFGLFDLQIPSSWQTRLNAISGRQRSGSFIGAAVMGFISAAVITTCVTPPLVAALAVIAKTGDVARGALALFALGIGMGLPLLAIGASAGRLIPKAGAWMDSVKAAFGLMMLAMAVWMLDRLWPGTLTLALWAVLLVIGGVFLGAFAPLEAAAPLSRKIGKGFGIVATIYGAALLLGALAGNEDALRPLQFTAITSTSAPGTAAGTDAGHVSFTRIKTLDDLNNAVARASAAGQPVLLDFYADWCVSCKEMEKYTFPDPAVQAILAKAVVLQADVTAVDADDQALMRHFGIVGPPTIMFFTADGRELSSQRVVGFKPAAQFAAHLERVFAIGPTPAAGQAVADNRRLP
ncbi:MAG: protein-disulfide reductase DsbD [Gammaproteobacteria bacterium PRO9]|nr:protein-disulfide reductase DsbD [Gammaproteobacteria bacterium PRO9]